MSCPWDPVQSTFRLAVRHYESKTYVKAMAASDLMMAGVVLLCAAVTGSLLDLNI